jgi:DNA polymerase III subunit delta'
MHIGDLPSGLMLVGTPGLGKLDLAFSMAQSMLCRKHDSGKACDTCRGCLSARKGLHPDLHFVTSEAFALELSEARNQLASRYFDAPEASSATRKPKRVIGVNQVRLLIERLGTHSHRGGVRLALVAPASSLNVNAANALLKILEEPPGDTRFLLVCASRNSVPATILSRVTVLEIRTPAMDVSTRWLVERGVPSRHCGELLALTSGAPLAAFGLFEKGIMESVERWREDLLKLIEGRLLPVAMAAGIGASNAASFLFWLERLLFDVVSAGNGRRSGALMIGESQTDTRILSRLISLSLWDIIDRLQYYRCRQQRAIDEQLFLEDVLIALWEKDRSLRKAIQT